MTATAAAPGAHTLRPKTTRKWPLVGVGGLRPVACAIEPEVVASLLVSHLLHLIEHLQGPLWHLAFSACTDNRTGGDHIGLESLLPQLIESCKLSSPALITAV